MPCRRVDLRTSKEEKERWAEVRKNLSEWRQKKSNRIEDTLSDRIPIWSSERRKKCNKGREVPIDKDGSNSSKVKRLLVHGDDIGIRFFSFSPRARRRTTDPISPRMLLRSSITALHLRFGRLHYRKRVAT